MIKDLPDKLEQDELFSLMKEWELAGLEVKETTARIKRRRKRVAHVVMVNISAQPYRSNLDGLVTCYTPCRSGKRWWVKVPYDRVRSKKL